ncbi:MAG: 5'-nucleotidase C-terminal domain-containing protein [Christensenella sp.]
MRHIKASALLLSILFILMLIPGIGFAAPAKHETVINIYHTNDIHGHAVGNETSIGYARFQTMLKNDSSNGRLIFDAGNAFSGNAFANLSNGQSIAYIMGQIGYNAITPGDHDFDYGSDALLELIAMSNTNGLAINIERDGQPLLEPYRIFEKSGIKIGVIGVATPDITKTTDPRNIAGLEFLEGAALITSVQGAVNELRAQNVNAVIVLSSLGTSDTSAFTSINLATGISGIDLIIDSQSNEMYPTGNVSYKGYIEGRTPMLVQAGKYFETFGVASLTFDNKNVLTNISEKLFTANEATEFSPNKAITETIVKYETEQQPTMSRYIGDSPVFLNAEPSYLYTGSTNFGLLCTNAMLRDTGADIAILNSGSIRASIPAGPISFNTLYNTIPFDDYIVTTTLTGAELKELLNAHLILGDSTFPQFAGINVIGQKHLNDDGKATINIQSIQKSGKEISDTDVFSVAILDFMYYGGDDYSFTAPISKENSTLFSAVSNQLKQSSAEQLIALSHTQNLTMWEETIDAPSIIAKLQVPVPDDIHIFLNQPSIVPDSVIYPLVGQPRNLVFSVNAKRPYALIFNGENISAPMNVNLEAGISQDAPRGKRTASSADKNAVFLDLSHNDALPADTHISIYVGDVYSAGSLVYLYYYDANRDILPLNEVGITVDPAGLITFPVSGGTTYLVNSKLLNAATVFENPSPEHPYFIGIIILCSIFALWVVFFIITKKGAQKNK